MLPRICEDVAWSTGGFSTTSKKGLNETNGHGLSTRLSPWKEELAALVIRRFPRPFDPSKGGASGTPLTANHRFDRPFQVDNGAKLRPALPADNCDSGRAA